MPTNDLVIEHPGPFYLSGDSEQPAMICVEIPVKSLILEVEKLERAQGESSEMYARGALDTLHWLIEGTSPASEGGGHFPLILRD